MKESAVWSINGPVVTIKGATGLQMMEMVYVGKKRLIGEVINISDARTTIQVYEPTTGLAPGEPVIGTDGPLCATLGPGILRNIFDGIQRPLKEISLQSGAFIPEGSDVPSLDMEKKWQVKLSVQKGDQLSEGQIFAVTQETPVIEHRAMVPPGLSGEVVSVVPEGEYTVNDALVVLKDKNGKEQELRLAQKWPIKVRRPVAERLPVDRPLITGQRVIDTLFPMAKGGTAAVPGGFGAGKTMTQHQLAKWSDADIIIYIGCGERGNEMTQVLQEFSELADPKTGSLLTDRTALIANTSNMPVAAREASVYTGITLAEYYRDMGYHVAVMADSTSRWAEALREISGRLEEMPAEEGYPAYLPSRISQFYERAGYMKTLCGKEGSVSIIGAVSPQGADFSEPVTQNTKRFVRCFWALDKALAYARHYPAINWNTSYSEYLDDLAPWYAEHISPDFMQRRREISSLLLEENKLMEIVKLIGSDVLPDDQKLILEAARIIRVGLLQQNAYHQEDTYVPLPKQLKMMEVILYFYEKAKQAVARNIPISEILEQGLSDRLVKMKYDIPNANLELFDDYYKEIDRKINSLLERAI
ncbi:MAG: V-type ATP synthase subunit A [Oscillospiraceae bacterium]|nr:V-type ATP synthase subunit A [Oscillospiraceae bacterium]MCI9362983.1 V-type ATP synthase subunit A [Oscillospiraceae bacterium]MCI9669142.1 V-type ATP synthase subunit A [Oscillospiraceae bacterium]RKJ55322.1 V-type ATP synthase subunit A [bacterium 1XD42-8]RKJ66442.1 V-type ATP synthase subunit A [bacterium 1XD42-1]